MGIKIIGTNKKAGFEFQLMEKIEAGIILQGTEVKVLREGKVSLGDSYVMFDNAMEVWAYNINIPHYSHGNIHNHEEQRIKKLLLSKQEINKIFHKMKTQMLTIVVTKIYFKDSKVKVELALAKGKKLHDKRAAEKDRDTKRSIQKKNYENA